MAAVASISLWRPLDGKLQDFVKRVATAKKIHERLGGRVRVWQNNFGGQPMGDPLKKVALSVVLCSVLVGAPALAASDLDKFRRRIDKSVVKITTSMTLSDIIAKAKTVCVCPSNATGLLTRGEDSDLVVCQTFVFDQQGKVVSNDSCGTSYTTLPK